MIAACYYSDPHCRGSGSPYISCVEEGASIMQTVLTRHDDALLEGKLTMFFIDQPWLL